MESSKQSGQGLGGVRQRENTGSVSSEYKYAFSIIAALLETSPLRAPDNPLPKMRRRPRAAKAPAIFHLW